MKVGVGAQGCVCGEIAMVVHKREVTVCVCVCVEVVCGRVDTMEPVQDVGSVCRSLSSSFSGVSRVRQRSKNVTRVCHCFVLGFSTKKLGYLDNTVIRLGYDLEGLLGLLFCTEAYNAKNESGG